MPDNPLWTFSLQVYGEPGVEAILLRLQDDWGADVNLLLACGWLAATGREWSPPLCKTAIGQTASWRDACIRPLRQVRRYLKSVADREDFRARVKALELEAERDQQQQLCTLLQPVAREAAGDSRQRALRNLQLYVEQLPGADWRRIQPDAEALVEAWMAAGVAPQ